MEEIRNGLKSLLESDDLSLDCAKVLTDLRKNNGYMLVGGTRLKYVVLSELGLIEIPKAPHYVEALYCIELTEKGRRAADKLAKESYNLNR